MTELLMHEAAFYIFGVLVGALGTLVGVGGGFIVVPVMTFLEPHWQPRTVTAFSLAVVMANALSGSAAYLKQGRVDRRSVVAFAIAASPGAVGGVFLGNAMNSGVFDRAFGIVLIVLSLWLLFGKQASAWGAGSTRRVIVSKDGAAYAWSFDMRIALTGCIGIGAFSALFGIGGGPITVPFFMGALNYPAHIATATSHGMLAVTSLVATIIHACQGDYHDDLPQLLATAAGALSGAPMGASLSRVVSGTLLLRVLAVMLALVALELFFR